MTVALTFVGAGGWTVKEVFFDKDEEATRIHIEHDGKVDVEAPSGVEFRLERDNERVIIDVRPPAPSTPTATASPGQP